MGILLVAVPLGCGLLACVYRLYQSNRVLNAQLDIEMEDVPRSAIIKAMKGPQSRSGRRGMGGTKKYSRLIGFSEDYGAEDSDEDGMGGLAPDDVDMDKMAAELEAEDADF